MPVTSPPDPPDVTIAAQRTVIAVLREALDAERARSDGRPVALAEVLAVCLAARTGGEIGEAEAVRRISEIAESCMPDRERGA